MANQIVHEALEFVRPIRLQVEHTSIDEVLQTSLALADSKVSRGEHRRRAADRQRLAPDSGDHHQLCQLFTNLVINAFEALDGAGQVRSRRAKVFATKIRTRRHWKRRCRTVVVEVATTVRRARGLRDRIFNAFFTTKPQGSGLGLAIVRKVVDAHDGRIDIQTGNSGTRFQVTSRIGGQRLVCPRAQATARTSTDD
jgi:nitrogen-specific signal transduction histidine kinase